MLEDEVLTPEQFSEPAPACPALYRPCLALLADLFRARGHAHRSPHDRYWQGVVADDVRWLAGEPAQLSLDVVCRILALTPHAVRRAYFSTPDPARNGRHPNGDA